MMLSKIGLIVFDLDGTLVDSREDLAQAVNATLEHCRRAHISEQQVETFIGDGAAMLVRRALEATGATGEHVAEDALSFFLDYYRGHLLDSTHVYPGVLQALQTIRALRPSLPMAVLTNKPVGPSRRICDALGLSPYFFANYGGNSFPSKKPQPEGLLQIVAEARAIAPDITAARTVLVGDSDVDVKTARAAGAMSLGCDYGYAREAMQAARPDHVVSSPSEWPAALGIAD